MQEPCVLNKTKVTQTGTNASEIQRLVHYITKDSHGTELLCVIHKSHPSFTWPTCEQHYLVFSPFFVFASVRRSENL